MPTSENKRIAKNSIYLYLRMIFLTLINLFTVRITLQMLGVMDYGIYNVIGSLVASFTLLTGTLTSACQRFLSFHLGKNDVLMFNKTYSLFIMSFIGLGIVILIVGSALGIVLVPTLNIPIGRMLAAKIVFFTSLVALVASMITIPFTSSIIANEKMNAYAYLSIIDGGFKLGLVYILTAFGKDKLILYGILTMVECIVMLFCYSIYCNYKFKSQKFIWFWEKNLAKELFSYTGWNFFGAITGLLQTQGQNVVLNLFFGPIVNAAKAISDRISTTINSFAQSYFMAVAPPITKAYASGDYERMKDLGLRSSKLSFFLTYIISFPLICCMNSILLLWLGTDSYSEYMTGFAQLGVVLSLVYCLQHPINQMIRATGKVKEYQVKIGISSILYIPIIIGALALYRNPLITMYLLITLTLIIQIQRILLSKKIIGMPLKAYFSNVLVPICIVSIISVIVFMIYNSLNIIYGITSTILSFTIVFTISIILVWFIGFDGKDRSFALSIVKRK